MFTFQTTDNGSAKIRRYHCKQHDEALQTDRACSHEVASSPSTGQDGLVAAGGRLEVHLAEVLAEGGHGEGVGPQVAVAHHHGTLEQLRDRRDVCLQLGQLLQVVGVHVVDDVVPLAPPGVAHRAREGELPVQDACLLVGMDDVEGGLDLRCGGRTTLGGHAGLHIQNFAILAARQTVRTTITMQSDKQPV